MKSSGELFDLWNVMYGWVPSLFTWNYNNVFNWPYPNTMEKEMASHSSTLAWEIPGIKEPSGLQYLGSQRVGHDWATNTYLHLLTQGIILGFPGGSDGKESACNAGDLGSVPGSGRFPGEGNGYPLQYSCLENSMGRGSWWATVHGVAELDTAEQLSLSRHNE